MVNEVIVRIEITEGLHTAECCQVSHFPGIL